MQTESDCNVSKPCEEAEHFCVLDGEGGKCQRDRRNGPVWHVRGKKFIGTAREMIKQVNVYFDDLFEERSLKCKTGADYTGEIESDEVGFFEFKDKTLDELRRKFRKYDFVGFLNIDTGDLHCELRSNLINTWKSQTNLGIALSDKQIDQFRENANEDQAISRIKQWIYDKRPSVFYKIAETGQFLESTEAEKILSDTSLYVVIPQSKVFIDKNPRVISAYHNLYSGKFGDRLSFLIPIKTDDEDEEEKGLQRYTRDELRDLAELISSSKYKVDLLIEAGVSDVNAMRATEPEILMILARLDYKKQKELDKHFRLLEIRNRDPDRYVRIAGINDLRRYVIERASINSDTVNTKRVLLSYLDEESRELMAELFDLSNTREEFNEQIKSVMNHIENRDIRKLAGEMVRIP